MTVSWQTVDRPGYFGSSRDARHRSYDAQYGVDHWRIGWQIGAVCTDLTGVCMLYEDAYLAFLAEHRDVLEQLVTEACDVYDDAPSNVASGLDYLVQETVHTHLQDVAIRRCVLRLGEHFRGSQLIQIRDTRGEHPLSLTLSPGRIPFHRPDLIIQPELTGWWQPGSVESFYQSNKVLQVKAD